MASVQKWSKTAANNATADPDINLAEGQPAGTVNDAGRAIMQGAANYRDDIGGQLTSGGTANAQTLTTNQGIGAYADGLMLGFVAGVTNTGAATLAVDTLGAKAIRKVTRTGEVALDAGDIQANGHYTVRYDASANGAAGAFILLNPSLGTMATRSAADYDLFGVLVTMSASQSIPHNTSTILQFGAEVYEQGGNWWDPVAPGRITVPAGFSFVRVSAAASFADNTTGVRTIDALKNGVAVNGRPSTVTNAASVGPTHLNINSSWLPVVAGDYFQVFAYQNSGAALDVLFESRTWFAVEGRKS